MHTSDSQKDAIETNRRMWDDRVEAHWKSAMYTRDADALRTGGHCLREENLQAVGDVRGKSLIQLQCHMGMETLSWARLGAEASGLDFSAPAIEKAKLLRDELGLKADFYCANIYDAPKVVGRRFDVVFQSIGCLCWLPDLAGWAKVVAAMLEPGGRYVLDDGHPTAEMLEQPAGKDHLEPTYPYLDGGPIELNEGGTYADPDATFEFNESIEHIHPLGDVITRLIEEGLVIDRLTESAHCGFPRYPMMDETSPGRWDLPGKLRGKVPMHFTLVAHKPVR